MSASSTAIGTAPEAYERAFRASPVALAINRMDGRFVEINDTALRLFGLPREEVIGRTSLELGILAPESSREHAALTVKVRERGSVRNEARTIRSRSGELHELALLVDLIEFRGEDCFLSTFLDISDHRRAVQALAASESRYRQIVEMAREGICVSDAEGRFTFVNQGLAELLGYQPHELIGMSVLELMGGDARLQAEAQLQRLREGIGGGGERTIRHRDGRDLWVRFESSPIMDGGRYTGTLSTVLDLTERRRAEELLRKSEAGLQEAQALAHLGSWEWDLRTDTVNRSPELCRIFGTTHEAFGRSPSSSFERVHPEDRERLRAELERATRQRRAWFIDYRIMRADGVRYLHTRGDVICDEAGAPVRMVGTAQDITDRKETEARLLLADRMASVGTLAAGMAHEINNPLAYVISNLDLIAEEVRELAGGAAPPDRLRALDEMAREARQGAERVRKIVRGLKTFSRADEDRPLLLDVKRVLELAINMAFNEIRHRARLVKDYGEVPAVEADEARLGQVFLNLLVNAAHAIREGQVERNEIRVRTRTDRAGRAVIEIRDTGCGIAPQVLGRIFDPFFTTKPVGDSTGLGLAICHGVVAALGGEITVESEPGKGSTFRVALPPAPLGSATAAPASRGRSSFDSERRGRVLVIDDEAMLTTTIQRVLNKHEVTVAGSGREALEKIAARPDFEVILCDLMMPEMTGMDFHAELSRLHPELLDRVVYLTGGAFTPAARAFLDGVPNERVEKPFDPQNLRALVQRFVR